MGPAEGFPLSHVHLRVWRGRLLAVALLLLVLVTALLSLVSRDAEAQLDGSPQLASVPAPIPPAIEALWQQADGPVLRGESARGWLWGPAALAVSTEHYDDSPTRTRQMVWYDKGRLDINDPNGDPTSIWYASGAQLVTELVSGALQFGADEWVRRDAAEIAITGDDNQAQPITYATLTAHATIPKAVRPADTDTRRVADHTGRLLTALLAADGHVEAGGITNSSVAVGRYDAELGHNVAAPFADWEAAQPYPALYLLGHPLTEPYWIDTTVDGQARRVLIQAFERRVLSYSPDNPEGWKVESANVGTHYRRWRGLGQPYPIELAPLAAYEPFAEELLVAATSFNVDPSVLVAIAQVASGADPSAAYGLALLPGNWSNMPNIHDPLANANAAAQRLAASRAGDERSTLIVFHGGVGDAATGFADAVLAKRDEIRARYAPTAELKLASAQPLAAISTSSAYAFPASVSRSWWERSLSWYGSWYGAQSGWQLDSQGRYCTLAGFQPGDRLRLIANGVSLDCTIGSDAHMVGEQSALGLDQASFTTLGLASDNSVTIYHLGAGVASDGNTASQFDSGAAAFYAAGYDRAWWDWVLSYHAGNGYAVAGWTPDPNGYYCVHPDYLPGSRLRLVANGVTLDCTVGDAVQSFDQAAWRSNWAVEMSWDTFKALGLDGVNVVEVYAVE